MAGRLLINGVEADINDAIPFPLSYSIADYKVPDKRKRNSSKTIRLAGTQKNRQIFKNTYSLSIGEVDSMEGLSFNTTQRIPAKYYWDDILQFDGLIQLMDVEIINEDITFNCILLSSFIDLFKELGDIKLSELDFSEYDHILNQTNVQNSWDTSVIQNGVPVSNFSGVTPFGWGYLYPVIDWGYTGASKKEFRTNDLIPAFYCREVIEKCFEKAGLTITGGFTTSEYFRRLVLTWGGGRKIGLSAAEIDEKKISATLDLQLFSSTSDGSILPTITGSLISYNDISNSPYNSDNTIISVSQDDLTQLDTNTGVTSVYLSGNYNLQASSTFALNISLSDYTNSVWSQIRSVSTFEIIRNGAVINKEIINRTYAAGGAADIVDSIAFSRNIDLKLEESDELTFILKSTVSATVDYTGAEGDEPILTVTRENTAGMVYDLNNIDTVLQDGQTVYVNRYLPDIKASDFLKSMITMFNLYISDPNTDDEVTVLPLDDFYSPTNEFDDWTDLVDHSKPIKITPASSLIQGREYKWNWSEDSDYLNAQYRDTYGLNYGDYSYQVQDSFNEGVKEFKVAFAATPCRKVGTVDFIIPQVIKYNESNGVLTPHSGKPRLLRYNGLKSADWKLTDSDGTNKTNLSEYPQVNHVDDTDNPTLDINFGFPKFVYWDVTTYTTNNLFKYHEKNTRETTNADAKFISLYIKLNPAAIYNLDFSRLKMINGSLFRLNGVKDYDASKDNTTQVELLRVLEGDSPSTISGGGKSDPSGGDVPIGQGGKGAGFYIGTPIGDSISPIIEPMTSEILITDNDAVNDTITLPEPLDSTKVTIKKISSTNIDLKIVPNASETIDGQTQIKLRLKYESRTLIADGTNWHVI